MALVQEVAGGKAVTRFRYLRHWAQPYDPVSMAGGPDRALWITDPGAEAIERVGPAGDFTSYPLPNGASSLVQIVAGPESSMWFTDIETGTIDQINIFP